MSDQSEPGDPIDPDTFDPSITGLVFRGYVPPGERLAMARNGLAALGGRPGAILVFDPDRAEHAVRRFDQVLDDLSRALTYFWVTSAIPPSGADGVSVNLAEQANLMATRAEAYVRALKTQVEHTRDALVAQNASYRRVDEENTARLP